jgi:hypothetical protein
MFVVKPLVDLAEPRAFLSPKAATEWAEYQAYSEFGAEVSEIHWVECKCSPDEAIEAVRSGKSEKRATVHRKMSPKEIAELTAAKRREWERKQNSWAHTPITEESPWYRILGLHKKHGAK